MNYYLYYWNHQIAGMMTRKTLKEIREDVKAIKERFGEVQFKLIHGRERPL